MEKTSHVPFQKVTHAFFHILLGYWAPVFLWMITIFLLFSQHEVAVSEIYVFNFLFFKTLHVIEYATLFLLTYRATAVTWSGQKRWWGGMAFIIIMCYAVSDELHQLFVPSRSGALRDVIIDGIGAASIWYYLSTQLPKAPKKLKDWARNLDISY